MTQNPNHIAIIMDGNGRWAATRNKPRIEGHRAGATAVEHTLQACIQHNINYVTLFGFSAENWLRPESEIDALMELLKVYLHKKRAMMMENDTRFKVIGDRNRLAPDIQDLLSDLETDTAHHKTLTFVLALSYGSRQEITYAFKTMIQSGIDPESIDDDAIRDHLYTKDIPDPDLIIRTSGEQRLSNFLLWQAAYSELYYTDVLWPDFDESHIKQAIDWYQTRNRRFGRVG